MPLAAILLFYHLLPVLVAKRAIAAKQRVQPTGNSWSIGKYSEEDVRRLAAEITSRLEPKLQRPRIVIAENRATRGWTWLSFLWPGRELHKTVWITAGALHYLEPDELQALIAHEIAHHMPSNRCDIPGGWTITETALYCFAFVVGTNLSLGRWGIVNLFLILRLIGSWAAWPVIRRVSQRIERLCDTSAADQTSLLAMSNMLLKIGEDAELTEVIIARSARRLVHVKGLDPIDLAEALEAVRPYGRLFHEKLFRHSSEIVTHMLRECKLKAKPVTINPELEDFARQRSSRRRRIRWRLFDRNNDGRLDEVELSKLCQTLREHPDRTLFCSAEELNPTTHPSCRNRVLWLSERSQRPEAERHSE